MLIIKTKYVVEEPIKCEDEEHKVLYEFNMQITEEELQKVKDLIFDEASIKKAEQYDKLLSDGNTEEANKILKEISDISIKNQKEFEDICFKDHKEPFKEKCGEYRYTEMVEMMSDFFWSIFMSKNSKRVNTILTDLMKILPR